MRLDIKNCNSIDKAVINLVQNKLNIKYAINGTGKTTIAKAIELKINDNLDGSNNLLELKPFKQLSNSENNPSIEGVDSINSIAVFNESYVEQYVFLPDDLLKNSFDIFIRDDKYNEGIEKIEELIHQIKIAFQQDVELNDLIIDLNVLKDCFGKSKTIAKSSSLFKGLSDGNKLENIPSELNDYADFIRHDDRVKWLKWQLSGKDYLDISDVCPYCTTTEINDKKEVILAVEKEYDSNAINHLTKVIDVVEKLKEYFSDDTYEMVLEVAKSAETFKPEHQKFLLEIKEQISILIDKLESIKNLNFTSLKDVEKVIDEINTRRIDLAYLTHINSPKTAEKVNAINTILGAIIDKAGLLQGEVNKQKRHIEKTIVIYKTEINNFLKYAGYNYEVDLVEDKTNQSYRLILKHTDITSSVENPKMHLSYGERNAFALVLFMFEAVKNDPNLVILDDPISSFDKNKKFAIINMLFRSKISLQNKTVLMLTHDFDPIVDMFHMPSIFPIQAHFLENINGLLREKEINRVDVKTFLEIAKENMENLEGDINKLIYLRRVKEINNERGNTYQLLSNLFKTRDIPVNKLLDRNMLEEEIGEATVEISEYVEEFDYTRFLELFRDTTTLINLYKDTTSNYEKLQLYRVINPSNSDNSVIKKFVNETYHLENDYLYQLNPSKYQTIPNYIIEECNKDVFQIEENLLEATQ